MKNIGSILFKLITLIILAIAGVWIAAMIMGQWYKLELSGTFVKWKELHGPQNFQEIVHTEYFELRAQADDGKIYAYTTEWKEWQPDPGYVDFGFSAISTNCESLYGFTDAQQSYPPPEAGTPIQCGLSEARHPLAGTVDIAYYVLLDNGKIWMWRHTRDPQQEIFTFLAGLFVGLIAGIIGWFLIQKRL